jgi:predicted nucleotidyltransferase
MRLEVEKIDILKDLILKISPNSEIFLFGSRVYDEKKGGDIDILVLSEKKISFIDKAKIEKEFFKKFGEQKLDIITFFYNEKSNFKNLILKEAIKL